MGFRSDLPDSGETIYVSKGGDDTFSGLTEEVPVLTIMQGTVNAIASGATNIDVGDGNYDEQVTAVDDADIRGLGTGIYPTATSATGLIAASTSTIDIGFIGAASSDSTAYRVDGKTRAQLKATTMVLGAFFGPIQDNITGIEISGSNDDIPITIRNGENRATNSTLINLTGESVTAIPVDLGTFTNTTDGLIGVDCNSSDPEQIININLFNFSDDPASAPTNCIVVTGTSGMVSLSGNNVSVPGNKIAVIESGLQVSLSLSQVAADIENKSGGQLLFSEMGLFVGEIDLQEGSSSRGDIEEVFGELIIDGSYFGDINTVIGDFTIGATGVYTGNVHAVSNVISIDPAAISAGNVNARINGVTYGNFIPSVEDLITVDTDTNDILRPDGLGAVEWLPFPFIEDQFTQEAGITTMLRPNGAGGVEWLEFPDIENQPTQELLPDKILNPDTSGGVVWVDRYVEHYTVENLAADATANDYGTLPDIFLDIPQVLNGGDYDITFTATISNTSLNRQTVIGFFIDNVLQFDEHKQEMKNPDNDIYVSKTETKTLTAGNHEFKVLYGTAGGAGSLAIVGESRIIINKVAP